MYKEIPISVYSRVQTGKKTHEGGLKTGFASRIYQSLREEAVNTEPTAPANWQRNKETRSLK